MGHMPLRSKITLPLEKTAFNAQGLHTYHARIVFCPPPGPIGIQEVAKPSHQAAMALGSFFLSIYFVIYFHSYMAIQIPPSPAVFLQCSPSTMVIRLS